MMFAISPQNDVVSPRTQTQKERHDENRVSLFGADGGTRYGATRLHAHGGENRSPNAFLPKPYGFSLLFESLFT